MNHTKKQLLAVPLKNFKKTKIIATLGPATNSYEGIYNLIKAGANGLRLNFSHGDYPERDQQITWIRQASKEYGKPVAIIQDLQGPKIRLGDFEGVITVQANQSIKFGYRTDYERSGIIPTQYDLSKKVKRGHRLYLCDGNIHTTITSVKDGVVHTRADNDGILIKRKGINLPDTDFAGDIITVKDKKDMAYSSTRDFDYIAVSFVQTAEDVRYVRTILKNLGGTAHIIAKIETKAAAENLEEIVMESDVVMVARGDLAHETLPESVPIIQREIIGLGIKHSTPTIVATQMLSSMQESPSATRAEIADIASAVIVGADCLMLSDETTVGNYPIQAVNVMKKVILYTEAHNPLRVSFNEHSSSGVQEAITSAVVDLASNLGAQAIVAETNSGATARLIAAHRPQIPLIVVTTNDRTAGQLSIVFGAKSYVRPVTPFAASKLTDWLRQNNLLFSGNMVVTASGAAPGVVGATDTIKVRVLK